MTTKPTPPADRGAVRPRLKRILNLRLLVETLVVAAIVGPAAYLWYSYQVNRTADALLERAKKLELEEKDYAGAARDYFQYLKLKPSDANAQILLAEAFDNAAKDPAGKERAIEYYYQAIGVAPSYKPKAVTSAENDKAKEDTPAEKERALRGRLAELLIEQGRFAEAKDEAQVLLKHDANDRRGSRLLAKALYGESAGGSRGGEKYLLTVGQAVRHASQLNPDDVGIAAILANIYRNQPLLLDQKQQNLPAVARNKLADQVMDKMMTANPTDAKAALAHHRYLLDYHPDDAKKDLTTTLKNNPENLEVVLLAASESRWAAALARQKGGSPADAQARLEEAKTHYEHAMRIAPADTRAYVFLADLYKNEADLHRSQGKLELAAKNLDDAVATLRRGEGRVKKADGDLEHSLAEALLAQGKLDVADKTITGLEQIVERLAPLQSPRVKLASKRTVDLLRGRWLMMKGRDLEAVRCLRRVAVGQQATAYETGRSVQAWQLLGVVYAALGQWDQAALAHEHAATLDPTAAAHHLNAAAAWRSADRLDAAEQHYRQALSLRPAAETRMALAGVLFDRQLRVPNGERNWNSFNEALAEAKKASEKEPLSNGWRLKLLEADYLTTIADKPGQREKSIGAALAICRDAERGYPDAPELLPPLADAYERLGQPADADRVIKRLEAVKGQEARACLLKARFCISRKKPEEARKILTAALQTLPKQACPAVRRELVGLDIYQGKIDLARQHLLDAIKAEPRDLESLAQLAGIALENGKLPEVEQLETELRKLEGDNGIFWRFYRAHRLLAESTGPGDGKLAEAAELQAFVQSQRPSWSKPYVLKGLLCDARGDYDQAMEAYREAVGLGERSPSVVRRLISRLLQANRGDEADQYLTLMRGEALSAGDYAALSRAVAEKRVRIDRALESARLGVEQFPANPLAQLWLGQLLSAAGPEKTNEAEAALKKAVALGPDEPRTLEELFSFYNRTRRLGDAREVLQRVAKSEKLDKLQRASTLARGYGVLGDNKQAIANFREAARLDPKNPVVQVQLADYLERAGTTADHAEAERLLRDVLQESPSSVAAARARQLLVAILISRGGKEAWEEARNLVDKARGNQLLSNADRRVQAIFLWCRGGKANLAKAQEIFEALVADPKKTDDKDRRLAARFCEAVGNSEGARQQLLVLVTRSHVDPDDAAAYIDLLLKGERFDDADAQLKKWEASQPDNLGVALLRAHWLKDKGQLDKIEPLLEPLAEKAVKRLPKNSQQEEKFVFGMGELYSSLDLHKDAERWYRRLLTLRPKYYLPLAGSLARQGRMREAIELCSDAAKSDSSTMPARAAAVALLAGNPSAEDFALAEPLLSKAAADHKDDANLAAALGSVRVAQQRLDQAAELFRRALKIKPDNADMLNNLATVLAERSENRQEALQCINLAIEIAGQQPNLLDTKGTILMLDGKPAEAVPLLEQAATSLAADPRYHLHLAVAYDGARQPEKAHAALQTACKNHLTRQVLTPTDRDALAKLQQKFKKFN